MLGGGFFDHAGSRVVVACIVNFDQGTVDAISEKISPSISMDKAEFFQGKETKNIYIWKQYPFSKVHNLNIISPDFQKNRFINLEYEKHYDLCVPFEEKDQLLFYCVPNSISKDHPLVKGYAYSFKNEDMSASISLKKEEQILAENENKSLIEELKISLDGKTIVTWTSESISSSNSSVTEYKNIIYILKKNPLRLVSEKNWVAKEAIRDIEFIQDGRFLLLANQGYLGNYQHQEVKSAVFILDETGEKKSSCNQKDFPYGKIFLLPDQKHYWLSFYLESFLKTCPDL